MEWGNPVGSWSYVSRRGIGERWNRPQLPERSSSSLEDDFPARLAPIATLNTASYQGDQWTTSIPCRARTPQETGSRQLEPRSGVVEPDVRVSSTPIDHRHASPAKFPVRWKASKRPKNHRATSFEFVSIHGPSGKQDCLGPEKGPSTCNATSARTTSSLELNYQSRIYLRRTGFSARGGLSLRPSADNKTCCCKYSISRPKLYRHSSMAHAELFERDSPYHTCRHTSTSRHCVSSFIMQCPCQLYTVRAFAACNFTS